MVDQIAWFVAPSHVISIFGIAEEASQGLKRWIRFVKGKLKNHLEQTQLKTSCKL